MKVLLVENPSHSDGTVRALTQTLPCAVSPIASVDAVGGALRQYEPDLIIAHHAPPDSSAIAVLCAAQRIGASTPVIALVERPDVPAIVECLRSGVADVVARRELFRLGQSVMAALGIQIAREARVRAAVRLRASEEQFRLLAENFPGVLYLRHYERPGSLLYLSEAVEELTGYARQAFVDRTVMLSDLRHPDDRIRCEAETARACAAGQSFHLVYRLRHRFWGWRWIEERGVGIRRNGELVSVEGTLSDITSRQRLERRRQLRKGELEYEVTHDALTGLVNRTEFGRRLERALQGARSGDGPHALCYLDLDRFKPVNDLDGHAAGDAVLRQVGHQVLEQLRGRDTLARIGGDEFALLLEHCSLEQARAVTAKIVDSIREASFSWKEWDVKLGASIGIVSLTEGTGSAAAALSEADSACYVAKRRGGSCVHVAGDPDPAPIRCEESFPVLGPNRPSELGRNPVQRAIRPTPVPG